MALCSLDVNVIKWPTTNEKQIIKNAIQSRFGIPFCIGIMDGVLIPLTIKPNVQGEDYFTCKMNHALSTFVVSDHEGKFSYINVGYVGSTHDNLVFTNSPL